MSRVFVDSGLATSISHETYKKALEVLVGLSDLPVHEVLMLLHHVDPHGAVEQRLAEPSHKATSATMKVRGGGIDEANRRKGE